MLKFGADYLVDGTIAIAKKFEISERVIAVTVVAIGTSIPELATSIVAALKKEHNLAIGNLIGSNIFNILAVLGVVASVKEITIVDSAILSFDYVWMIIITFVLGLFIYTFSNSKAGIIKDQKLIYLFLFISIIVFLAYRWNYFYGYNDGKTNPLFIPHITKIIFFFSSGPISWNLRYFSLYSSSSISLAFCSSFKFEELFF